MDIIPANIPTTTTPTRQRIPAPAPKVKKVETPTERESAYRSRVSGSNAPIKDYMTKNASFLQTAVDLKNLGINNYTFFLILYDRGLQGVDPHDPNISEEMMIRVINECMINPWYFLRECVRIPEQGGSGIKYQLHRANLAATFCFLRGIDHYLVIPRQKGKTQSTIATLLWSFIFGTSSSEFMFINKSQGDANNNLGRLKAQRELLPKYMRLDEFIDSETGKKIKETNNVMSLYNPVFKNKIITKPSASNALQAENIGRGSTQPIQYFDEVEFTNHVKTIIQAAGPAYNTASATAKRNNAAHCRIFTSTPGDLDTGPGKDGFYIVSRAAEWTEKFYDWSEEQIRDYIRKNAGITGKDGSKEEGNGIVYIEYNYLQLGDDETWLRKAADSLLNDKVKIKREIFLKRMRGSSESPFEAETLDILQEYQKEPIRKEYINSTFLLDIYAEIDRDRVYFIGVDVSHGLGSDNSAVTVIDPYTLEPVAEFASPYIGTSDLERFLRTLVRKFFPRGILCIERNNAGEGIIDHLRKSEVAGNLYYDDTQNPLGDGADSKLDSQGFLQRQAAKRKLYGVWTQHKNRSQMFDILDERVKMDIDKFYTKNITNDILALIRKPNGRIEAGAGFHDDSIMSYLIAMYVYYHGKNLARFGFVRGFGPNGESPNAPKDEGVEVLRAMPDDLREHFDGFQNNTLDDLIRKNMLEIQQARRELEPYNKLATGGVRVENLDEDVPTQGRIDSSFFDMLNE